MGNNNDNNNDNYNNNVRISHYAEALDLVHDYILITLFSVQNDNNNATSNNKIINNNNKIQFESVVFMNAALRSMLGYKKEEDIKDYTKTTIPDHTIICDQDKLYCKLSLQNAENKSILHYYKNIYLLLIYFMQFFDAINFLNYMGKG